MALSSIASASSFFSVTLSSSSAFNVRAKETFIWMGGLVPLGYRVKSRKLHVVPDDAERVRHIYLRYTELKSVYLVKKELDAAGIRSRIWQTRKGVTQGGVPISNGNLRDILRNPIYPGLIKHRAELHQGQHQAIIDKETFDTVQAILSSKAPSEADAAKRPTTVLFRGRAFDGNGNRLQPIFCNKRGVRFYYYTSARRLKDIRADPEGLRIPAGDLERLVARALSERLRDGHQMHSWLKAHVPVERLMNKQNLLKSLADRIETDEQSRREHLPKLVSKITVSRTSVEIELSEEALAALIELPTTEEPMAENLPSQLHIGVTSYLLRCGMKVKMIIGSERDTSSEPDPQLVAMIAKTRNWFEGIKSGRYCKFEDIAVAENCDRSYVRRLISLAFLAPDIVENILTGNRSPTLTPARLRSVCPLPMRWDGSAPCFSTKLHYCDPVAAPSGAVLVHRETFRSDEMTCAHPPKHGQALRTIPPGCDALHGRQIALGDWKLAMQRSRLEIQANRPLIAHKQAQRSRLPGASHGNN